MPFFDTEIVQERLADHADRRGGSMQMNQPAGRQM